jgi:hypothetical protein
MNNTEFDCPIISIDSGNKYYVACDKLFDSNDKEKDKKSMNL